MRTNSANVIIVLLPSLPNQKTSLKRDAPRQYNTNLITHAMQQYSTTHNDYLQLG